MSCFNIQIGIYSLGSIILATSYQFQQKYIFLLTLFSVVIIIMLSGLSSIYINQEFIQLLNVANYLILLNLTWNLALSLISIYNYKEKKIKKKLDDEAIQDIISHTKEYMDERAQRLLIRTINKHLMAKQQHEA